jgi:O-antigen ligase
VTELSRLGRLPASAKRQTPLTFGSGPVELGVSLLVATAVGVAIGSGVHWALPFLAIGFLALLVVGFLYPALFLALILLVRPILDRFSESRVEVAGVGVNFAGAVAVALILVAAVTLAGSRVREWTTGAKAFALVLVVSTAAAALAVVLTQSEPKSKPVEEIVRLLAFGAIYVLATNLVQRGSASVRTAFVVAALAAVVPAVVGIEQWISGLPTASGLTIARVQGTFSGPNAYGEYLAAAALILLFLPADWLPRWARISAFVVVMVGLVGSFSRTGWVMFLVGVVALGWRNHKRLVAALLIGAVALGLTVPTIRNRILSHDVTGGVTTSETTPASYRFRLENWRFLLEKYSDRPLTGFGLRSTPYVNPYQYSLPTGGSAGYDAHNTVVKLLVEGGPLLLGAWILFIGVMIANSWRMARRRWGYQTVARIVLVLWAIIVCIGVAADDLLAATALMLTVFALTGIVEGAWRRAGLAEKPA